MPPAERLPEDLKELVHRNGAGRRARLPVSWVVDILDQVCSALDDAPAGMVHRALKADNIWLEPDRRGESARLLA